MTNNIVKQSVKKILNKRTYNFLARKYTLLKSIFVAKKEDSIIYPRQLKIIGGKLVCVDLITKGSTIISGGFGNDIDFEFEMIKRKNAIVVGIDPTGIAEKFIENKKSESSLLTTNYIYLKKALSNTNEQLKLYYGENDFMSSVSSQHRDTKDGNYFLCEAVTLEELQNNYPNISYLKLDIEGAEYSILSDLKHISIPQISIEFHHHCSTEYTLEQSISLIRKIANFGYDVIDYGAFHGVGRKLPPYASKWSDLNCELLFIKQ